MTTLLAAAHESAPGTKRHFPAAVRLGRFRSETDMTR
jgi:hypothetical protein